MARKKSKAPKPIELEDESQEAPGPEAPEQEPTPEPKAGQPTMSKVDAVRAALAEGLESPEAATDFIRKRFGIEIGRQHFSATKSQLKRREGGGEPEGKRAPKGKRAPAATPVSPPAPAVQAAADSQPYLLDTLEAVKKLVEQDGADRVKRMVGLLGG